MKKLILAVLLVIGTVTTVVAQPRAIGGRMGWGLEASYQHSMASAQYLQLDLGLVNFYGTQFTGTYNWIFATPDWTDDGTWEWFAGVGAGTGFIWETNSFFLGVAGNVGLSYTFPFNLQLSVDYRPILGPRFGTVTGLYGDGFFNGAVSVRYAF